MEGGDYMQTADAASPASSQAAFPDAELGAILARCGELPLENASLKCTTESGEPLFQLRFKFSSHLLYGGTNSIAGDQPRPLRVVTGENVTT
jgi:hypothetical protein